MKYKKRFKGILFDMDGVLVDSMQYHCKSFQKIFKDLGISVDEEEIYKREGQASREIFEQIFNMKDVNLNEDQINKIVQERRKIFSEIEKTKIFKQVKKILPELRNHYKLGVVSGSNEETVKRFVDKEFNGIFDSVVTGDDVSRTKPDPEPFYKGSKELELEKNNTMIVENAPLGIKASDRAEMYCIAVATYLPQDMLNNADIVFNNHDDLVSFMREELL